MSRGPRTKAFLRPLRLELTGMSNGSQRYKIVDALDRWVAGGLTGKITGASTLANLIKSFNEAKQ